ncbi:MAG: methionine--tRNA ligase, partial [Coprobacillus sp.]|nr:methionine--tRNA ligase [Coprobacillus sp.]
FVERINMDLVNSYGNLLNRTIGMVNKYFDGVVPQYKGDLTPFDKDLRETTKETISKYEELMDDLKITDAFICVNDLVNRANKYIDETQPWALFKEGKIDELASVMSHLINVLYVASQLYRPVLVESSEKAFDQLNIAQKLRDYKNIYTFGIIGGQKLGKSEPLFPRLDENVEVEAIKAANNL